MRKVAAGSLITLLGACLFPSLDGLTGDAGLDGSVISDTSTETIAPDASTSCSDAGPNTFCAHVCPAPAFCDDFDHDLTFSRWTDGLLVDHGTGVIVDDASVSQPNAAWLFTNVIDGGQASATPRTRLASATTVTVDLDALIATSNNHYGFIELSFDPPAGYTNTTVFIDVAASAFDVLQQVDAVDGSTAGSGIAPIPTAVPFGSWFHVTFVMDVAAHTMQVAINGASVGGTIALSNAFVPSGYTMRVGIYYVSGPAAGLSVHVDNVVVHAT